VDTHARLEVPRADPEPAPNIEIDDARWPAWAVPALLACLVTSVAGYVTWLAFGPHRAANMRDAWLSEWTLVVSCALAWLRGLRDRHSRPWLLLAVGMSLWTLADGVFSFGVQNLNPTPNISPADVGYLAFYPCVYVALLLLLRQHVLNFHMSGVLDGVLIALGLGAFGSLTIAPASHLGGGWLPTVVNTSYPTGDVLLLVVTFGLLTLLGADAGGAWWCLLAGCALFAVSDTSYLVQGDNYHPGTMLDAGWPAAMALFAIAGWLPARMRQVDFQGAALLAVPWTVALTSIGFLVAASRVHVPIAGVVLAGGALLAVLVRTALSFREVAQLAETRRQAHTDELTGLANRRRLNQQLDLLVANPGCDQFAVLLIDLDRFKEVNDALGHGIGDELLCELGDRLVSHLREVDLVARLGGDEYAILLTAGANEDDARAAAARTLETIRASVVLAGSTLHVDASIGIALYPQHGSTHAELLRCADVAMYRAKRERSGTAVYSLESDAHSRDRLRTVEELRVAIEAHQLVCHYQPKLDMRTGRVVGAEALIRWQHPMRGVLPPSEFLHLAEQNGLMSAVLIEVLDQALPDCREWRAQGHDVRVAVNLSVSNLLDTALHTTIHDRLRAHGLSPRALVLEITEDVLMTDPNGARLVLEQLRALGINLSLDDYGTGYNSLAYLQALPIDELKVDRSFVTGIATNPKSRAIVEATVALGRSLGLDLVAEGIETEADWLELEILGVDMAQGYWLSRPQPAENFVRWLAAHRLSGLPTVSTTQLPIA
jgi:diguanylate cyclase (GGDEF)-like protein